MKIAVLLRGLPGSGKSAYAAYCKNALGPGVGCFVTSADHYHVRDGAYDFKPENAGAAHAACFKEYLSSLRRGDDVVVCDNTNLAAWELAPYVLGAEAYGYRPVVVDMKVVSRAACLARQTHGVPEVVFGRMVQVLETEQLPTFWARESVSAFPSPDHPVAYKARDWLPRDVRAALVESS